MTQIQVRPLAAVGAEIQGIDLARVSSEEEFQPVHDAFAEHGLVFFRDQNLSEDQHIALAERFGQININRFFAAHPDHPQIATVTKEPDQKTNIGGGWHTDHSYDEEPALGSILVARELPPDGGDTWFTSMYAAYDALSDGLKETLAGMRAVHSAAHIFGSQAGTYGKGVDAKGRIGNAEAADVMSDVVHPVVITHPLSGRKALYVNPGFTVRFDGWTKEESAPLLGSLYGVACRKEFVTQFQWQPGSIAFWDNRATWHWAQNDYHGHRRVMHRITVEGCRLEA